MISVPFELEQEEFIMLIPVIPLPEKSLKEYSLISNFLTPFDTITDKDNQYWLDKVCNHILPPAIKTGFEFNSVVYLGDACFHDFLNWVKKQFVVINRGQFLRLRKYWIATFLPINNICNIKKRNIAKIPNQM